MIGYRWARAAYLRTVNREQWRLRQARRTTFSQFVRRGDLGFDIGACHGEITDVFASLHCQVVAVEPNPVQAEIIRKRYAGRNVAVEQAAVGEQSGEAQLIVGSDPAHSTLSSTWPEHAPTPERWSGTVEVRVVTLEQLATKYGDPAFIKIDVETYESQVLRGARTLPAALCFEFQNATPNLTDDVLSLLDGYVFTHTFGESPIPTVDWQEAPKLVATLRAFAKREPTGYGDIFARRRQPVHPSST